MLQRSIAHEISRRLKSPWTPPYCKSKGIAWERITPKMAKRGIVRCHLKYNNLMQFQQQQVKNLTIFNIYFQYFFNVG